MQPISLTVFGGMTFGSLMTLFLMPTIYYIFNARRLKKAAKRAAKLGLPVPKDGTVKVSLEKTAEDIARAKFERKKAKDLAKAKKLMERYNDIGAGI